MGRRKTGEGRDCQPLAVSYIADGIKEEPIGQGRLLPSHLFRLTAFGFFFYRLPSHRFCCLPCEVSVQTGGIEDEQIGRGYLLPSYVFPPFVKYRPEPGEGKDKNGGRRVFALIFSAGRIRLRHACARTHLLHPGNRAHADVHLRESESILASRKTNVVFILTDDQGVWAAGCYGNPEIRTPNIDRIADTGVRFENFFVASPVCSPSRASFLTGRIPSQHGVHDWIRNGNVGPDAASYLAGEVAYTDVLAERGWTCGISGKWHLGNSRISQHGFQHWFVHQRGGGKYNDAPMVPGRQADYGARIRDQRDYGRRDGIHRPACEQR